MSNFFELIFRNILLGYIILISLYSIWKTQVQTVNIVFIVIFILSWIEYRRIGDKDNTNTKSTPLFHRLQIAFAFIGALVLFLYSWFSISNKDGYFGFYFNQGDYILYGKIAAYLSNSGVENGFNVLNQLDPYYLKPEPYHFFDVWGAAVVRELFLMNGYVSLVLIIYPTFYFLCFVGYLSLFKETNVVSYIFSLLLLFVGGIYIHLSDSNSFLQSLSNISFNLLTPTIYKLSYFYVFLISTFILYSKNQIGLSILSILCLLVANIITVPTIFPAIIAVLWVAFLTRGIDKMLLLRFALYSVIVIGAIALFYFFNKRLSAGLAGAEISSPFQLLSDVFSRESWITRRNIILGGILSIAILYLPFVIINILNKDRLAWRSVPQQFIFFVISTSLLVYALLYVEFNAAQIFFNIAMPVLNVTIAVALINKFNDGIVFKENKFRTYAILSLLLVSLFLNVRSNIQHIEGLRQSKYSYRYLSTIDRLIDRNSVIASLKGKNDMIALYQKYNAVYPLGDYLLMYNKNAYSVNIGDLATPIDSTSSMNLSRSVKALRDGLFYRYSKKPEFSHLSEEELIVRFLKEHHIKYIIISKEAQLPPSVLQDVKIMVSDSISKEQFVVLK